MGINVRLLCLRKKGGQIQVVCWLALPRAVKDPLGWGWTESTGSFYFSHVQVSRLWSSLADLAPSLC